MASITQKVILLGDSVVQTGAAKGFSEAMDATGTVWKIHTNSDLPQRYSKKLKRLATVTMANHRTFRSRNAASHDSIELTKDSKVILAVGPAELDGPLAPKLASYMSATEVAIRDVANSPEKIRMTVSGKVIRVFEMQKSPTGSWTRQDFVLQQDRASVKVKLWNEKATHVDASMLHKHVTIQNVSVEDFKGEKSLGSTLQTAVKVKDEPRYITVFVTGLDLDPEEPEVDILTEEGVIITVEKKTFRQLGDPAHLQMPFQLHVEKDETGKVTKLSMPTETSRKDTSRKDNTGKGATAK